MSELPQDFCARLNAEEARAAAHALDAGFDSVRVQSDIDLFVELVRIARRPIERTDAEEIERPRCGCPSETVRRVIVDHGTCARAGCPYGGDV